MGLEALVRWNHPVRGLIPPGVFLPLLENNGLITKLDLFIWEEVFRKLRRWIDRGHRPVPISVNVSRMDIYAVDVAAVFKELADRYAIEPRLLEVEITESTYVEEDNVCLVYTSDAMNIDLKGFTDRYYRKLGGSLEVVKHFIERAAGECHVELTTLIVPGENDSEAEIKELAAWVASVNPRIPLHITRFFPMWKMTDRDATDIGRLYALVEAARGSLEYVFAGNC